MSEQEIECENSTTKSYQVFRMNVNIEPGLRSWRLVAYGGPAIPLAVLLVPLGAYLPAYYSSVMGLSLTAVGVIFFMSRLWDGITDPLIGILSDNTRLRWGRRKSWIVFSVPPLMYFTYLLLSPSGQVGSLYLGVILFVFYISWTAIQIPYLTWGAELAQGYIERNRVVAYREVGFMLGILIAVMVPALIFGKSELDLTAIMRLYTTMFVILLPVTVVVAAVFVTDSPHIAPTRTSKLHDAVDIMHIKKPFCRLVAAYFLLQLGAAIYDALFIFLVMTAINLPGWLLILACIQYIVSLIFVPVVLRAGKKYEKHRLLCVFAIVAPIAFVILAVTPEGNSVMAVIAYVVLGFSVAPFRIMPTSIVADTIDYDKLRSGKEREATHMAVFNLFYKLAMAAGVGIAFPLLDLVGFSSTGTNSDEVVFYLRCIVGILPCIFMFPVVFLLWNYPIGRERHSVIRKRLQRNSLRSA